MSKLYFNLESVHAEIINLVVFSPGLVVGRYQYLESIISGDSSRIQAENYEKIKMNIFDEFSL